MENQKIDNGQKGLAGKFNPDAIYSGEFFSNTVKMIFQFKIRTFPSKSMFALIKEGSTILDNIHVGDVVNMKYYSSDASVPTEKINTKIKYIQKDKEGRFNDHYLVGLEIFNTN